MSFRTPLPSHPHPFPIGGVAKNPNVKAPKRGRRKKKTRVKGMFGRERAQEEIFRRGQVRRGHEGVGLFRGFF